MSWTVTRAGLTWLPGGRRLGNSPNGWIDARFAGGNAGCATDACVPRTLKSNVIVITTASGRDSVTHSPFWARALTGFLLALVGWRFDGKSVTQLPAGTATVQEAIEIGNKFFPKGDSFVLANGNGSVREF